MRHTIQILAFGLLGLICEASTITLEIIPTSHTPLIIEIKENTRIIRVTRHSGQGGYEWGPIDIRYERELDEVDFQVIREKLKEISFWNMPKKTDVIGPDGSVWKLTVKEEEREHSVSRWTPQSDTEERNLQDFVDLGFYLADICGIHPILGKQIEANQAR